MKMMTKRRRPTVILQICFLFDSFVCCALVIEYIQYSMYTKMAERQRQKWLRVGWFPATSEGRSQKRSTINWAPPPNNP
jgi:hypothetical protein